MPRRVGKISKPIAQNRDAEEDLSRRLGGDNSVI